MHYTVAGGRLPSGLSTFQARKHAKDYWSADPPAWSLRMTRRLRALLLSVLLTIYLIYYLNIFPLSHVVAVLADADHQVKSNTTIGESPAGRTTPTATKYQPVAVTRVSTVTATATVHSISRVIKFDEQAVEQLERHKAQDKDAFINNILSTDIRGVYDGQSLYNLCSSEHIKWNPSVVISCPSIEGGFGDSRNAALSCLRVAIEAGASLILPRVSRPYPIAIPGFRMKYFQPFSYLFDTEHFKSTLATYCPQLTIHDSLADLQHQKKPPAINKPISLVPYQLQDITGSGPLTTNPSDFHSTFHTWLKTATKASNSTVGVSLTPDIAYTWPTTHDPAALVRSFSGVLRPSHPTRLLAAEALYSLVTNQTSTLPERGDFTLPFIGIHLPAADSTHPPDPADRAAQTEYYLARLKSDLIPSLLARFPAPASSPAATAPIYISGGDPAAAASFAAALNASFSVAPPPPPASGSSLFSFRRVRVTPRVVTLPALVPRAALAALSRDGAELVDFLVLGRAAYLMGPRGSAAAWALAMGRAAAGNYVVGGFPAGLCWVPGEGGEVGGDGPRKVEAKVDVKMEKGKGAPGGAKVEMKMTGSPAMVSQKGGEKRELRATGKDARERKGRRRGCEEDLGMYEYWRDDLTVLVGAPGNAAADESGDAMRLTVWP